MLSYQVIVQMQYKSKIFLPNQGLTRAKMSNYKNSIHNEGKEFLISKEKHKAQYTHKLKINNKVFIV